MNNISLSTVFQAGAVVIGAAFVTLGLLFTHIAHADSNAADSHNSTATNCCPTGYTGTYPDCVPPTLSCPTGYTGTYPNCVPPTLPCPPGSTGTYPSCVYPAAASGAVTINNNNANTSNNVNNNNSNSAPVTVTGGSLQYAADYGRPTVTYQYQAQTQTYLPTYSSGYNWGENYGYNYQIQNHIAPSVSLTQIPYTGFDFGSFGDSIYFALLAAFGVATVYLVAYYAGAGSFVRKIALKLDGVRGSNLV